MPFIPYKIKYALIAAVIVPCLGRIALNGSGVEHDLYRYIIPLSVGATSGFLIGHFLDKWHGTMRILEKKNDKLKQDAKRLDTAQSWHSALFEKSHSIILVLDPITGEIIYANPQASSFYGYANEKLTQMSIYDINTQSQEKISLDLIEANKKKREVFYFKHRLASGEIKDVEVFSGAINIDDTPLLLSFVLDITELNRLRGILSICSHCKKIRNKKGGWTEIETFIGSNSAADFSHGLCPGCLDELYPEYTMDPRLQALKD